jgi:hypothetical protein
LKSKGGILTEQKNHHELSPRSTTEIININVCQSKLSHNETKTLARAAESAIQNETVQEPSKQDEKSKWM